MLGTTVQRLKQQAAKVVSKIDPRELYTRPGRIFSVNGGCEPTLAEIAAEPIYAFEGSRQEQVNRVLNTKLDAVDMMIDPIIAYYPSPEPRYGASATASCGHYRRGEDLVDFITNISPFDTPWVEPIVLKKDRWKPSGFKPCILPGPRHYKNGFTPCSQSEIAHGKTSRMESNSGT